MASLAWIAWTQAEKTSNFSLFVSRLFKLNLLSFYVLVFVVCMHRWFLNISSFSDHYFRRWEGRFRDFTYKSSKSTCDLSHVSQVVPSGLHIAHKLYYKALAETKTNTAWTSFISQIQNASWVAVGWPVKSHPWWFSNIYDMTWSSKAKKTPEKLQGPLD